MDLGQTTSAQRSRWLFARAACHAAVWVLLVVPALARADAIPPAPQACPPSTLAVASHSGAECVPRYCTDDAGCAPDEMCHAAEAVFPETTPSPFDPLRPGFPTIRARTPGCLSPDFELMVCVPRSTEIVGCAEPHRSEPPPARAGCASCHAAPTGEASATLVGIALALAGRRWRGSSR